MRWETYCLPVMSKRTPPLSPLTKIAAVGKVKKCIFYIVNHVLIRDWCGATTKLIKMKKGVKLIQCHHLVTEPHCFYRVSFKLAYVKMFLYTTSSYLDPYHRTISAFERALFSILHKKCSDFQYVTDQLFPPSNALSSLFSAKLFFTAKGKFEDKINYICLYVIQNYKPTL